MNTWLRVGAKCVCVDARPGRSSDRSRQSLILRAEYLITAVSARFPVPAVQVDGNGLSGSLYARENWWLRANRFRPLVSLEDDVALFTSMRPGIDLIAEHLDELAR